MATLLRKDRVLVKRETTLVKDGMSSQPHIAMERLAAYWQSIVRITSGADLRIRIDIVRSGPALTDCAGSQRLIVTLLTYGHCFSVPLVTVNVREAPRTALPLSVSWAVRLVVFATPQLLRRMPAPS